VVAPQQEHVPRMLDFVEEQEKDDFGLLRPAIHHVAQEQVVGLGRPPEGDKVPRMYTLGNQNYGNHENDKNRHLVLETGKRFQMWTSFHLLKEGFLIILNKTSIIQKPRREAIST
jgi:hypothetical protein